MVLDTFLQHLATEKHYSLLTVKAYRKDLEQFFAYLSENYDITNAAHADHYIIRSWLASLFEDGISPRSINRKLSALKTFYKFLQGQHAIADNPMGKVVSPKATKKLPEFIDKESMDRLFSEIVFKEGFVGARDRLVLEILYSTGMRVSELVALQEKDVDLSLGQMRVTGKRNKQRVIPFGPNLGKQISEYIYIIRREVAIQGSNNFLITTNNGQKAYPRLIYGIVHKYLALVTTKTKKSPHVLRHTFATLMLNNGADLNAIKELLGHASLAATQVYTHNTIDRLKKIYQQAHPKA
ncbi:MAG: tyrosine-type recombinase/integrase [Bacteroidales bacterium]|nr:tyrosine-type recombinase/integrase [Bacteroidales bacterium]